MGTRIADLTNLEEFGLTAADFFEGDELQARLDAGQRACLGIPSSTPDEAAIRMDIYRRNAPTHKGQGHWLLAAQKRR